MALGTLTLANMIFVLLKDPRELNEFLYAHFQSFYYEHQYHAYRSMVDAMMDKLPKEDLERALRKDFPKVRFEECLRKYKID